MAGNYHFDHHRREALTTSRRFAFINAVFVALLAIGGGYYYFRATHASTGGVGNGHHSECLQFTPSATVVRPGQKFSAFAHLYNDGQTSWSSSFGMFPTTWPSTTLWNATGPGFPSGSGIGPQGHFQGTFSLSAPSSPGSYPLGFAAWIATVGYIDNTCNAVTVTVTNPPGVTLLANGQNNNIAVTKGGTLLLAWSSTNNASGCTASGSWSGAKAAASAGENHTADTGALGTRTYTLYCSNGVGAGTAVSRSVTVVAAPPPAPTPTPKPTPAPAPKPGSPSPSPSVAPATAPDKAAPSKPGNFAASLGSDGSSVNLSWDASTDDHGVQGYFLERSLDQQKWDTIADSKSLTLTSFTDNTTTFKVHYFYRLRAVDTSGNQSDLVTADITTGDFNPNASSGESTIVRSGDGLMMVTIPANALNTDASCSLDSDTTNKESLSSTKLILAAGPYQLVCKDGTGNLVDSFQSDVVFSIAPSSKAFSTLSDLKLYSFDSEAQKWVQLTAKTDNKTHLLSASVNKPVTVAALGSPKKGISWNIVFGIIFIIIIIAAIVLFRIRQQQKQQYADYMRRKYYNF